MKVFLSWSSALSHRVACELRDWLPSVLQAIKPYVSSEDIDKGTRWSTDIAKELEAASYGIICVTYENLDAPWVHFEAGALSKSLEKANVVPFLFGVKRSEVQGPLLQFQSVIFEKDDVEKLVRGLNKRLESDEQLSDDAVGKAFKVWWPQLKEALDGLERAEPARGEKGKAKGAGQPQILEEILELVRTQQRMLSSPETLLPREYLRYILRDLDLFASRRVERIEEEMELLHSEVVELDPILTTLAMDHPEIVGLSEKIKHLHDRLHSAARRRHSLPPRRFRFSAEKPSGSEA